MTCFYEAPSFRAQVLVRELGASMKVAPAVDLKSRSLLGDSSDFANGLKSKLS